MSRLELPAERSTELTRLDRVEVNIVHASRRFTRKTRCVVVPDVVGARVENVLQADLGGRCSAAQGREGARRLPSVASNATRAEWIDRSDFRIQISASWTSLGAARIGSYIEPLVRLRISVYPRAGAISIREVCLRLEERGNSIDIPPAYNALRGPSPERINRVRQWLVA